MNDDCIFGGVEGGGTKTILCLMNNKGELLTEVTGSSTNPWNVGLEKCCDILSSLVAEAKKKANINADEPLYSLGLCLSGVETEDIKNKFMDMLVSKYPSLTKNYYIGSDTRAPLAMVHDKGGVVLISGTGSNCLLINPDESEVQCGGFGDRLGDEGSAYGTSYQAIKLCLDSITNLSPPPNGYSEAKIWEAIKLHFDISSVYDIIPFFYVYFDKSKVAALCLKLLELAKGGDPLSKWLFETSGRYLAKHIQAIYSKADESLKNEVGGLRVVCVGSVWQSWDLIKPGFVSQLNDTSIATVNKLTLLVTTKSPAIGAVYLAARTVQVNFAYSFEDNYRIFYKYVR